VAILNTNYAVIEDEHGLMVIEATGRCTADERAGIEADCTRRFKMVPLPNAAGAILKAMDGTGAKIVEIEPDTLTGARYRCVKVRGSCNPMAYTQPAGAHAGKTILTFYLRYQQVSGVA